MFLDVASEKWRGETSVDNLDYQGVISMMIHRCWYYVDHVDVGLQSFSVITIYTIECL